jgi:putative RNA 2'-phosphotransferase
LGIYLVSLIKKMNKTKVSKLLSLVLRHKPEVLGLKMDKHGWVDVTELLTQMNAHGTPITQAELEEVVATNAKQRFKLDLSRNRIRANQGHSLPVDVELAPQRPPKWLYHGTAVRNLHKIKTEGLKKMRRQHVHLSADYATAVQVGQRYGKPVVLRIDCQQMVQDGHTFWLAENGVWLTNEVAAHYLRFAEDADTDSPAL